MTVCTKMRVGNLQLTNRTVREVPRLLGIESSRGPFEARSLSGQDVLGTVLSLK